MLAVNVSFLAVPGVASQTQTATPMMILIYISTLCSVGSLVSSILLVRQSRGQSNQTADEAVSPFVSLIIPTVTNGLLLGCIYAGICSFKNPYGMAGNRLQLASLVNNVGVSSGSSLHSPLPLKINHAQLGWLRSSSRSVLPCSH